MNELNQIESIKRRAGIRFLAGLAGVLAFAAFPARAQTEIDPDHFDSPNTEPFEKTKPNARSDEVRIRYEGEFTLPYKVQCNGKGLAPGEYSVSLLSNGEVGQAILNPGRRAIPIPGVVRKQANKRRTDAIVVEVDGRTRKLSAIHVGELDLVLGPAAQLGSSSDSKTRRFDWLPMTGAVPIKR